MLPTHYLGLDKIEFLQNHENQDIYQKAFDVIERYFGSEDVDNKLEPTVDENAQQYQFNVDNESQQGGEAFQF